ncbi:MAG: aryl-sulfate sulfotransferase [bacterium]
MNIFFTRFSIKRKFKFFALFLACIIIILSYSIYKAYNYPIINMNSNNKHKNFGGYTLFTHTVDDIGLELNKSNKIYLMNIEGEIVHTWHVLGSVQLAKLKPDGNLLYTTRDRSYKIRAGLREIDPFGNIIWYYKCWADHDFYILPNGNILLHYIEDKEVPAISKGKVRCPRIVEIDSGKKIIWEWRGEDHLNELSEFTGIQFPLNLQKQLLIDGVFDWAHSNTCQVIEENATALKDPRFRPGNILFSYCTLSIIGVINRDSGKIVWAWGPGKLDGQHNPRMMENGNIILFDNGIRRGYSRIIELNPLSEEIVWEYSDRYSKNPKFYSRYISGVQLLPNGNFFICQGEYQPSDILNRFYKKVSKKLLNREIRLSRLFEINRSKEIVWEVIINSCGINTYEVYQATRYTNSYIKSLFKRIKKEELLENENLKRLKSLPYVWYPLSDQNDGDK